MAKYSSEFKQQIVHEYLEGTLGYSSFTKKYQISSKSQIETWVRQYKQSGKNSKPMKSSK